MKNQFSAILAMALAFGFVSEAQAKVNWRLAAQVGFTLKSAKLMDQQKCYLAPSEDKEYFLEAIELKVIENNAERMLYDPFNPDVENLSDIKCDKRVVSTCLNVAVDSRMGECGTDTVLRTVQACMKFSGKARTACLSGLNRILIKDGEEDGFQAYLEGARSCLQENCMKRVASK